MININLKNKTAIVTGGASGLGKSISQKLAESGAKVCIADINYENAKKVASDISDKGMEAYAYKADVTNFGEMENLTKEVVSKFNKIDIMVNNAGIGLMKPILAFQEEEIDRLINIDLKGVINGSKAALKYMSEQKDGKIINMSSVAAKVGAPNASVYAAAKSGVIAFTNSLSREFAQENININSISPGIVRTEMWEKQLDLMTNKGDDKTKDKVFNDFTASQIPMQRPQEPEDIAYMVAFLASDLGRNITGQNINIDGGSVIY